MKKKNNSKIQVKENIEISKNLLFSIITVVLNNNKTISDAIESVLSQDYKPLEYIVIDGNSNDGTLETIKYYESKINKVISEKDTGIYDALNKGLYLAKGDIIGFLNSDDLYINERVLSKVASIFQKYPDIDILYGNLIYVKPNNIFKVVRYWTSKPYYSSFFEEGEVPPHPSLFVRKKVYDVVGGFNLSLNFAADYEFMLRIMKKYQFKSYYLNETLVRMRLNGTTNKSLKNIALGNWEIYKAWKVNSLQPPFSLWFIRVIKKVFQYFKSPKY